MASNGLGVPRNASNGLGVPLMASMAFEGLYGL